MTPLARRTARTNPVFIRGISRALVDEALTIAAAGDRRIVPDVPLMDAMAAGEFDDEPTRPETPTSRAVTRRIEKEEG